MEGGGERRRRRVSSKGSGVALFKSGHTDSSSSALSLLFISKTSYVSLVLPPGPSTLPTATF